MATTAVAGTRQIGAALDQCRLRDRIDWRRRTGLHRFLAAQVQRDHQCREGAGDGQHARHHTQQARQTTAAAARSVCAGDERCRRRITRETTSSKTTSKLTAAATSAA
jgi:hypothetical protein